MNKREAIAALRELADKLEAMPIDGEALRGYVEIRFHDLDASQFLLLKTLTPAGTVHTCDSRTNVFISDWRNSSSMADVSLFGNPEVICP